jgi:hypothetical protein
LKWSPRCLKPLWFVLCIEVFLIVCWQGLDEHVASPVATPHPEQQVRPSSLPFVFELVVLSAAWTLMPLHSLAP